MPIANKALAVLAALAFFMPFVAVSTSVPYLKVNMSVSVSGEKLVQCYLSPCTAKDILGSQPGILGAIAGAIPSSAMTETIKLSGKDVPDLGINFLLFAAIAVVIAAITLFLGRGGELLSGVASVGVIVLLFMFRSKIGDAVAPFFNSPELQAAGGMAKVQFQYGMGFWGCAVLSGLSAILAFKGTGGQRAVAAAGPAGGFVPPPQPGVAPPSGEKLAVCSACGSVNSAGSKFCLSCGAAMAAAPVAPAPEKPAAPPQGPACPTCGSSSSGTGKFCLACGASMAAIAAAPVAPVPEKPATAPQGPVCPTCGSSNAGTGKFCLACGASMAAAPAPEKPAAAPQGPVCPTCGSSNAGTGKFCLACGASMAAAPAPEKPAAVAQGPVCPTCGSSNPGTGKFCLACGGSLMAGVQLFQPDETSHPASPSAPTAVAAAAPAAMAAQASASAPTGQPLRMTAPSPSAPDLPAEPQAVSEAPPLIAEEPVRPSPPPSAPEPPVVIAEEPVKPPSPPPVAEQPSLDWTAPAPPPPPAAPKSQICAVCGTAINEGQKFCLACGTAVGQHAAPAPPEPPQFTPAPPEQMQPPAATQIFEPAPKSSSKAWIIIVIAVAALGAGGWFGWQYFSRPDVTVTAIRPKIHVAAGGRADLDVSVSGNSDIDWAVQEGQKGGQVTPLGVVIVSGQPLARANYTAPTATGVYHVTATSHANPGRSAQVEITVIGSGSAENPATPSAPEPPSAATATTSTTPAPATSPAAAFPAAAQIVGTWSGPTSDMQTVIGADSTISMTSAANPQKNQNGTYHFTDNSHLDVDFGNGDVRKWEILGIQGAYLRVSEQSKSGSSAIIFQKVQ